MILLIGINQRLWTDCSAWRCLGCTWMCIQYYYVYDYNNRISYVAAVHIKYTMNRTVYTIYTWMYTYIYVYTYVNTAYPISANRLFCTFVIYTGWPPPRPIPPLFNRPEDEIIRSSVAIFSHWFRSDRREEGLRPWLRMHLYRCMQYSVWYT